MNGEEELGNAISSRSVRDVRPRSAVIDKVSRPELTTLTGSLLICLLVLPSRLCSFEWGDESRGGHTNT